MTDKNFIVQPKINLQSFKSTPDSLKQRYKAFGRKRDHAKETNLSLPAVKKLQLVGEQIIDLKMKENNVKFRL